MLKITQPEEPIPVENIVVCLYGPPGVGKTSTAFTSSNNLLLDFDGRAAASRFRKATVKIDRWSDVSGIRENDLKGFDTVTIDTVGRCLEVQTVDILGRPSKVNLGYAGSLNQKGWGVLKSEFTGFLNLLRSFKKDVILLAHMDEKIKGDEVLERIDVQGGSKSEIYKSSDAIGRIKVEANRSCIIFSPSDCSYGKNPARFDAIPIPNFEESPNFFAGIIKEIKDSMNRLSIEGQLIQNRINTFNDSFSKLTSLEELNESILEVKDESPVIKRLLVNRAKELNFALKDGKFESISN